MNIFCLDINNIIEKEQIEKELLVNYTKFDSYDKIIRYITSSRLDRFEDFFIIIEKEVSREKVIKIIDLLKDRNVKSFLVTENQERYFKLQEKMCKSIVIKKSSMSYSLKKIFIVIKNDIEKNIEQKKIIKNRLTSLGTDKKHELIIGVGASSGGTETSADIYKKLPSKIPPMLMVQHMPKIFSSFFAERLNKECAFDVVEAIDGEIVRENTLYIAPGSYQMSIVDGGSYYKIKIEDIGLVSNHCPSVDYLFNSMSRVLKDRCVAIILTGMGDDGAKGIYNIRMQGGFTIGQDKESSVVYGMPRVAYEKGGVCIQLSDKEIPTYLIQKILKYYV